MTAISKELRELWDEHRHTCGKPGDVDSCFDREEATRFLEGVEHMLMEARYMGTMDFAEWVLHHDESSFRAERAWFKLKPSLITRYQIELMKNLRRIRSNTGLDKDSTVHQLKHEGPM